MKQFDAWGKAAYWYSDDLLSCETMKMVFDTYLASRAQCTRIEMVFDTYLAGRVWCTRIQCDRNKDDLCNYLEYAAKKDDLAIARVHHTGRTVMGLTSSKGPCTKVFDFWKKNKWGSANDLPSSPGTWTKYKEDVRATTTTMAAPGVGDLGTCKSLETVLRRYQEGCQDNFWKFGCEVHRYSIWKPGCYDFWHCMPVRAFSLECEKRDKGLCSDFARAAGEDDLAIAVQAVGVLRIVAAR